MAETRSCVCSAGSKASSASVWCGCGDFLRRDESGVGQPCFNRAEVLGFHTIQVRATDAEESLAVIEDGGQFVAVGEQHAAVDVRAVGQTDKGGEFAPRQRRASGAELDLIGVELAEQGLQHAVHALVLLREAKIFEEVERNRTVRPDLCGVVFPLRGEIGFGENFKGVTTGFFIRQCGDARFKLGKAGEAGEQLAVNICRRFGVLCLWHGVKLATSERARQAREFRNFKFYGVFTPLFAASKRDIFLH